MLDQAIDRYGGRGTARALGVTPAYISMISTGKKPLTATIEGRLTELVNTPRVNSSVNFGEGERVNGKALASHQEERRQPVRGMVGGTGFEPVAFAMSPRRSNQLS